MNKSFLASAIKEAFRRKGIDFSQFMWRLTSGRLPVDVEWEFTEPFGRMDYALYELRYAPPIPWESLTPQYRKAALKAVSAYANYLECHNRYLDSNK